MSPITYILLFLGAIMAGVINTVGGGGSVITLPLMILAGVNPIVANATNRIGVISQNIMGLWQFRRGGIEETSLAWPLTIAGCLGSIVGSLLASIIPADEFTFILALLMLVLLALIVTRPKPHLARPGEKVDLWQTLNRGKKCALVTAFFFLGIYGGFLQAGMGIMILLTLGYMMRLDLVRANYVKLFFVLFVQIIAAAVFIWNDVEIEWLIAAIMFVGQSIGAYIGAWIALRKGERWIIAVLIISIILSSSKLLWDYFTK